MAYQNERGGMARYDSAGRAVGADHVIDSTGQFVFDLASLPSVPHYDAAGNMDYITYGPDLDGRRVRQTSTWVNGIWTGDSAWVLV